MPDAQENDADDLVIERPQAVSDLTRRAILMKSLRNDPLETVGRTVRGGRLGCQGAKYRQMPPA